MLYKKYNIGAWELFSYYPPDKADKWYNRKRVYLLEPKKTGKNNIRQAWRYELLRDVTSVDIKMDSITNWQINRNFQLAFLCGRLYSLPIEARQLEK